MCTVFEESEIENIKGRKKQRAEEIQEIVEYLLGFVIGREEGSAEIIVETRCEFGFSEEEILERLQKKLKISLEKAQEYLERFRK